MGYWTGKKVFLAGGSEGIGRAAAIQLASSGASVVIAARRQGPLDETVAAMRAAGGPGQVFDAVSLDVTDRAAVRAAVQPVLHTLGGLDVVVTNVGAARCGYLHEVDDALLDQMLSLNYLGNAGVVRAFLPHLIAQRSGSIAVVSSALGFFSAAGYGPYSASKYALVGFTEALRQEMLEHRISVSLFYPGTTDTPGLATENATKPDAVRTMEMESSFNTVHSAEKVAAALLRAVERGTFENVLGFDNWLMWFMFRRFPRTARWLADMEWRKAVKKVEARKGAQA